MRRARLLPAAAFSSVLAAALTGCGGVPPSTAADASIEEAADGEEREGLIQARDDIDAEMRPLVEERDAEIDRLQKENAALRARLEARRKG